MTGAEEDEEADDYFCKYQWERTMFNTRGGYVREGMFAGLHHAAGFRTRWTQRTDGMKPKAMRQVEGYKGYGR
jgi:hypothetical protein